MKTMRSQNCRIANRRGFVEQYVVRRDGVTIMEALFAIGVVLLGLLGLAAVIPIAARRAKQTLSSDRATADATAILSALGPQQILDARSLFVMDEDLNDLYLVRDVGSGNVLAQTGRYQLEGLLSETKDPSPPPLNPSTANRFNPRHHSRTRSIFDSPSFSRIVQRAASGVYGSVCIDPRFFPESGVTTRTDAYRYGCFPYYDGRTNPLASPAAALNSTQWNVSPRMWRAGMLADPAQLTDAGFPTVEHYTSFDSSIPGHRILPRPARNQLAQLATQSEVENKFLLDNDLVWQKSDKDRSLDIVPFFSAETTDSDGFSAGKRLANNRYSWIATITPPIDGGVTSEISIVVMENRDVPDLADVSNSAGGSPSQERLTWVGKAIGFSEGAGGDVQIFGTNQVSTELKTGQWVMLSRQAWDAPIYDGNIVSGNAPIGPAVHRWFKVINVDEAIQSTTPYTTQGVWSRWVTLAGPDWDFGRTGASGFLERESGTFCTLVDGAISVITAPSPLSL